MRPLVPVTDHGLIRLPGHVHQMAQVTAVAAPPALDQAPNHYEDRLTRWLARRRENYRNSNRKPPTGKKKDLQYTLGSPAAHHFLSETDTAPPIVGDGAV